MQKVKVNRYVSGRRPDYAPESSDSESSDEEEGFIPAQEVGERRDERGGGEEEDHVDDRRLRRLRDRHAGGREERGRLGRVIEEPEVIYEAGDEEEEEEEEERGKEEKVYQRIPLPSDSESEEEELDDETIEKRRELMREKARQKALEEVKSSPQSDALRCVTFLRQFVKPATQLTDGHEAYRSLHTPYTAQTHVLRCNANYRPYSCDVSLDIFWMKSVLRVAKKVVGSTAI